MKGRRCAVPLVLAMAVLAALSSATGQAKVVKLRFMHWGGNIGMEEAVKRWNAQHSDIKVVFDGTTGWGDYFSKLPVMIAAGSPPDLFSQLPEKGRFEELAARGVMRDLTAYFRADGLINDMYPQAIESAKVNGKIYGAPFGLSNNGFMGYNIDIFEQSGVTLPTRNWTTADFAEAAKKMTKDTNGDGKTDIYGTADLGFSRGIILSAGGEIYNKTGTALALGSQDGIRAMQWIQDLSTKLKVVGGDFQKGKVAMRPAHPQQVILDVSQVKLRFRAGIAWFPKDSVTGQRRWEIDQNMTCLAANSKYPKEAWKFLKWFVSKDGLLASSSTTFGTAQMLPSLKSAARSPGYLEPNRKIIPPTFRMEEIVDGIEDNSIARINPKLGYELRTMLEANFTPVTQGTMSVQQFVTKSERDAQAVFARGARKK